MTIRPMELQDEPSLRRILHLADPYGDNHPDPDLIYRRWGQMYFEHYRDFCFSAVSDEGRVAGVILCSPDSPGSQKLFNRIYFPSLLPDLKEMEKASPGILNKHHLDYYLEKDSVALNRRHPIKMNQIYRDFPAHLHINIHPDFQRRGLGHKLVDRLIRELKERGVRGLHLIVASNNEKGIGFYRKYGFREVLEISPKGSSGIVYGLYLRDKR